jgi:hypothetical protein
LNIRLAGRENPYSIWENGGALISREYRRTPAVAGWFVTIASPFVAPAHQKGQIAPSASARH